MNELSAKFADLAERGERALILFVTGGDPSLEALPSILRCLEDSGADVIEVGLPFSDPIADGPVIQASSQRALDRGVTPATVLDSVLSAQITVPIVAMGYMNTALRQGLPAFAHALRRAGVAGTIMCDLTADEAEDWKSASANAGLDTIFLIAPTSTEARIELGAKSSTGFVYAVSRTGVTGIGGGQAASATLPELVRKSKSFTKTPVCVGFGIKSPSDVASVCEFADGAIVGSWLVQQLIDEWDNGRGAASIAARVRELKAATR